MSSSIKISDNSEYVIIEYEADILRNTAFKDFEEAVQLGKKHGIKRFLINLTRSQNIDSTLNTYEFAYDDLINSKVIDRTVKIALVVSPEDHSHDFSETVVSNIGFNIKLFRNFEKAVEYLRK